MDSSCDYFYISTREIETKLRTFDFIHKLGRHVTLPLRIPPIGIPRQKFSQENSTFAKSFNNQMVLVPGREHIRETNNFPQKATIFRNVKSIYKILWVFINFKGRFVSKAVCFYKVFWQCFKVACQKCVRLAKVYPNESRPIVHKCIRFRRKKEDT